MSRPINPFLPDQLWITINGFCQRYGVCRTTANKLTKEERFVVKRIGQRAVRILVTSADQYFMGVTRCDEPPGYNTPPAEDLNADIWADHMEEVMRGLDKIQND